MRTCITRIIAVGLFTMFSAACIGTVDDAGDEAAVDEESVAEISQAITCQNGAGTDPVCSGWYRDGTCQYGDRIARDCAQWVCLFGGNCCKTWKEYKCM